MFVDCPKKPHIIKEDWERFLSHTDRAKPLSYQNYQISSYRCKGCTATLNSYYNVNTNQIKFIYTDCKGLCPTISFNHISFKNEYPLPLLIYFFYTQQNPDIFINELLRDNLITYIDDLNDSVLDFEFKVLDDLLTNHANCLYDRSISPLKLTCPKKYIYSS